MEPRSIARLCLLRPPGAFIAAIGTSTSNFNTLVAGEVILGLGSITVANSQTKLYTHWFYGSYVGFAKQLLAISVASKATAVPIAERTGSYTWSFWVPCILCAASLVINALYYVFVNRLPMELRMPTRRLKRIGSTDSQWKTFWFSLMAIPASFWLITVSRICQTSSVIAFTNIAPDVIRVTRGISNATAGYIAALENVIPIILTPALG
ncbi:hypothetical protein MPER_00608 [Moniliophthora perniciosa FA553]|nr:hypothetical protein MPER_00608 [Moniliophthora perniciosa FA553]